MAGSQAAQTTHTDSQQCEKKQLSESLSQSSIQGQAGPSSPSQSSVQGQTGLSHRRKIATCGQSAQDQQACMLCGPFKYKTSIRSKSEHLQFFYSIAGMANFYALAGGGVNAQ